MTMMEMSMLEISRSPKPEWKPEVLAYLQPKNVKKIFLETTGTWSRHRIKPKDRPLARDKATHAIRNEFLLDSFSTFL
jgi:hypothetical protein